METPNGSLVGRATPEPAGLGPSAAVGDAHADASPSITSQDGEPEGA